MSKLYRTTFLGYSKVKHFPRQTRRSSHVWLQKLVNLELNFSSVSERTFQIDRSEKIGEALIKNVITKFGTPDYMMMDQHSAFMSSLMSYLFKKLGITIKTVGPYNHKSLQAEHGIKSLSSILSKHLTDQGQMWHKFLPLATFTYNIFHSPNLGNYSPYELVYGRKPRILINIETNPDIKISGTFKDYHTLLTKRLDYLQKMLQNFKMK